MTNAELDDLQADITAGTHEPLGGSYRERHTNLLRKFMRFKHKLMNHRSNTLSLTLHFANFMREITGKCPGDEDCRDSCPYKTRDLDVARWGTNCTLIWPRRWDEADGRRIDMEEVPVEDMLVRVDRFIADTIKFMKEEGWNIPTMEDVGEEGSKKDGGIYAS